jgi:hypothetical protein
MSVLTLLPSNLVCSYYPQKAIMAEGSSSSHPDLESGPTEPHAPRRQSRSISQQSYMYIHNRLQRPIFRSWSRSVLKVVDINCDSTMSIVADCHEEEYLFQTLTLVPVQRASAIQVFNVGFPLDWRE